MCPSFFEKEDVMILTVGNSGVYEVAAFAEVRDALREFGEETVLFKQDKCLESDHLSVASNDEGMLFIATIDGVSYNLKDFSAIYYLHPHLPKELLNYEPAEYRQFIHRQFEEMRRVLWSVFRHKKWINDPWKVMMAENKAYQMSVARRIGLAMPATLITSDPDKVRKFYGDNGGDVVVKLFAMSPVLNKVVYTNRVTLEHMKQVESVRRSPSIFQARVEKEYELRITVVGNELFPVKILSQRDEETALDWRRKPKLNDFEVRMEPTDLPRDIQERIHSFMDAVGLRFGCIDMIVTPKHEYVFLEVNPSGQWYFVQVRTHLKIAQAIARLLVS